MGGIPRPIGNFPEMSSHRIFAGSISVGRSGLPQSSWPLSCPTQVYTGKETKIMMNSKDAGLEDVWLASLHDSGRNHFDSVRFGSGLFENSSVPFGSVRFGNLHFPVRRGSACVLRMHRGKVRFGSVRFPVRFRPVLELIVSIQFGSAGSVRFLIPS